MKKLALFVEGLTEQLFAQRLIEEIAGKHQIAVELLKAKGGAAAPRTFTQLKATSPAGAIYYVLIYDCSGDHSVLTDIRDQYQTLSLRGYCKILGLRDVYPQPAAAARKMQAAMAPLIPKGSIPVEVLLAITEIEAWFLAEATHYERIHSDLTPAIVDGVLGSPLDSIDVETVYHPSDTLDQVYKVAGLRYTKERNRIARTIYALDCALLYMQVSQRISALGHLCREIDQFLT